MYSLGLLDQASSELSQVGAADKHTIISANDFVLPVVYRQATTRLSILFLTNISDEALLQSCIRVDLE